MYSLKAQKHIDIEPIRLMRIWRRPAILLREAKNIQELKVIAKDKNEINTYWKVKIDGMIIEWRQQDILDIAKGIINFKLIDGEFKKYQGVWHILPDGKNKTILSVEVTIDWGIPVLEKYVKKSLEKKSYLLFRKFLESIKKTAEDYEK